MPVACRPLTSRVCAKCPAGPSVRRRQLRHNCRADTVLSVSTGPAQTCGAAPVGCPPHCAIGSFPPRSCGRRFKSTARPFDARGTPSPFGIGSGTYISRHASCINVPGPANQSFQEAPGNAGFPPAKTKAEARLSGLCIKNMRSHRSSTERTDGPPISSAVGAVRRPHVRNVREGLNRNGRRKRPLASMTTLT